MPVSSLAEILSLIRSTVPFLEISVIFLWLKVKKLSLSLICDAPVPTESNFVLYTKYSDSSKLEGNELTKQNSLVSNSGLLVFILFLIASLSPTRNILFA